MVYLNVLNKRVKQEVGLNMSAGNEQMSLKLFEVGSVAEVEGLDWFVRLSESAVASGEVSETVAGILKDVKVNGDEAVAGYMREWTDPEFEAGRIRVGQDEIDAAIEELDPELRVVIEGAISNVFAYQRHIMPAEVGKITIAGAELGLRFLPVEKVGLAVPGGMASYPSSVIMLAIPALAAGVPLEGISVVTPPPTRVAGEVVGDVSSLVLATCGLIGISKVYRIGGAQGMAALGYGTETVDRVEMIVGPGNIFTQLAKAQLSGLVGIDGFYGPSEIVVIADETADVERVASDLIAQAEHDPGKCFLVAWDRGVIENVCGAIGRQVEGRDRKDAIIRAFKEESAAVLVKDLEMAVGVANLIAPEHMTLAVVEPDVVAGKITCGGELFLGDTTPVAAGDYYAGPSHSLPTGRTARFASGVSVYTFLKRSGTVYYRDGMPGEVIDAIDKLARAEGLDGHAASARLRG